MNEAKKYEKNVVHRVSFYPSTWNGHLWMVAKETNKKSELARKAKNNMGVPLKNLSFDSN